MFMVIFVASIGRNISCKYDDQIDIELYYPLYTGYAKICETNGQGGDEFTPLMTGVTGCPYCVPENVDCQGGLLEQKQIDDRDKQIVVRILIS